MTQITVEKTAEDSASKSLRVTVPVDRVREAEAKALKYYVAAGPAARVPPGQGARRRGAQAVRRRHPPDGARGSHPRELGDRQDHRVAQADHRSLHPEPQVRGGQPDRVRAPGRGAARAQAGADRRLPARAPGGAGHRRGGRRAAGRLQEQKAAWIPVEGAKPVAGPDGPGRGGAARRTAAPAPPSRTTWCWAQNQAIPELEERIMTLLPGETDRRRGQLSRRPSGRGPPGPDPPGAGHAARGEAAGAARRWTTPSPARSATSRTSTRSARRSAQDLEREAAREADAQVRQAADPADRRGQPASQAPESLVHRLMHGYAEMYKVPAGAARRSSSSSSIRSPRRQVRRDLVLDAVVEATRAPGHRGRAGRSGSAQLAAARGVPPASSTPPAEGQPAARARARHHRGEGRSPCSSSSPPSTRSTS